MATHLVWIDNWSFKCICESQKSYVFVRKLIVPAHPLSLIPVGKFLRTPPKLLFSSVSVLLSIPGDPNKKWRKYHFFLTAFVLEEYFRYNFFPNRNKPMKLNKFRRNCHLYHLSPYLNQPVQLGWAVNTSTKVRYRVRIHSNVPRRGIFCDLPGHVILKEPSENVVLTELPWESTNPFTNIPGFESHIWA